MQAIKLWIDDIYQKYGWQAALITLVVVILLLLIVVKATGIDVLSLIGSTV